MSTQYKVGDILDAVVVKIVPNGFGMAFAPNLTLFIPLAVAGDRLRVRIEQLKGRTAFAEISEIIEPSSRRSDPNCRYFGVCGGCDFQQMPYDVQLEAKTGIIRDSLERVGKIDFAGDVEMIPSASPFGYRARAQWHVSGREHLFGYFRRKSDQIVDVAERPILTDDLQAVMTGLRSDLDWDNLHGDTTRIIAAAAGGEVSVFSDEIVEPTHEISVSIGGHQYFYNANVFFQGNPDLIGQLVRSAIHGAQGRSALDLYSGVGLFSVKLSGQFGEVTGVEQDPRAADFAERTAAGAQLDNVRFVREAVAEFLEERSSKGPKPDFILLDPPRAGTERGVIDSILKLAPREISYVSCEPSILARDLRALLAGGYQIEKITAIDLFPQTHHVETVVRLSRSSQAAQGPA